MIKSYKELSAHAQKALQITGSPLTLHNGTWKIKEREKVWDISSKYIFDEHLDAFKSLAISVLSERDPSLEMPVEDRYMATIHNKILEHSSAMRKGVADGLALLGSKPNSLENCSQDKAKNTAVLVIREIFENADWILWGSLNDVLPALSEAAPNEFLNIVEKALDQDPCPFDELFKQEGNGLTGQNYMTGLLWALESLAWDKDYLVRVCVILGELAKRDPYGNWANRPSNSVSTILLPWLPQTLAPIKKRKVAMETLSKEVPDIAWNIIVSLLPNQIMASSGSHKPKWRQVVDYVQETEVTKEEFWEQTSIYAEMAVSMAKEDMNRLAELIECADQLPGPAFRQFLEILQSREVIELPESQRTTIWNKLSKFITKYERFSDSAWAMEHRYLSRIKQAAEKLSPSNPMNLYKNLFSERDFELYEGNEDFEEQHKKLNSKRQVAIDEIFNSDGLDAVLSFCEKVTFPEQVGEAFGHLAKPDVDISLLPEFLDSDDVKKERFINAYIWARYLEYGWKWADNLQISSWTTEQTLKFLIALPFEKKTWDRVSKWLKKDEKKYWKRVNVNPYSINEEIETAISKFIKYGRPYAAISCLYFAHLRGRQFDTSLCVEALTAAISSSEPMTAMDPHYIEDLIVALQGSGDVSEDDIIRIEWAYLPLLGAHHAASPMYLENKLATDPKFFCEIIQTIYRSQKKDASERDLSKEKQEMAKNAWKLLFEWKTPPGMQKDKNFNGQAFLNWLGEVKSISEKTGHFEVAMIHVGQVLKYAPGDYDGLWIHKKVADQLNQKDAEKMREGFCTEFFNSRGAHWVDPTGKPEKELADKYSSMAEEAENEGYHRLAITMRQLADTYKREAERIIDEHSDTE